MAVTAADLLVKVSSQGVGQVEGDLKRAGASVASFGETARRVGLGLTAAITAPLVGFGAFAVGQASDLDEAMTAAANTYGAGADFIIGKSEDAAQAVGLSQQEFLSAATQFGVFGQAAGLAGDDLAVFGNDMVKTAADLASFYNVPVPEALEAIRAGLTGETEPLRRFGIMLSDAELKAYALEQGIWDGTGAMTEQQKVLARQGYIMDHVGAAQDDFAETSGGLANQQRILRAEFRDVAAQIGRNLLPAALKLVSGFRDVLRWVEDLSPTFLKWGTAVAVAAAALGPLLIGLSYLTPGFAALGVAIGLVLSPIGLLVAAGAGLAFLFRDDLTGAVGEFVGTMTDLFAMFNQNQTVVESVFSAFGIALENLTGLDVNEWFAGFGRALQGAIDAAVGFARTLTTLGFDEAVGVLAANLQSAFGSSTLTSAVVNAFEGFHDLVTGEWDSAWANFKDAAIDFGTLTISGLVKLGGVLADAAADFGGWLKGKLFGGALGGDQTGGPAGSELSIGDLALTAALRLAEGFWGAAGNFGTWLRDRILAGAAAAVDLGAIAITAALDLAADFWGSAGSAGQWLIGRIGPVSGALGTWFGEQVGAVDWTGKLGTAWNAFRDFFAADALPKLGSAADALGTWWDEAVGIDWTGKLGTAWGALAGFVGTDLLPKLGVATDVLSGWWDEAVGVDWTGKLGTAWNVLVGFAAEDLPPKLGNIQTIVGQWWEAGLALVDWTGAMTAAINASEGLGAAIWGAVSAVIGGIEVSPEDIAGFGAKAGGAIHDAIVAAVGAIVSTDWLDVGEAVIGAIADIDWGSVAKVALIPPAIFLAIATAIAGFGLGVILGEDKANEVIDSIGDAIVSAFGAAKDFAASVWNAAKGALAVGVNDIDWGGIPGAIASSLWDAVKAWVADHWTIGDLVGAILGGGGEAFPRGPSRNGPGVEGGNIFQDADKLMGGAAGGGKLPDLDAIAGVGTAWARTAQAVADAVAKITASTLALQSRISDTGAAITNVTLAIESRLSGFAAAATRYGLMAGDGWYAGNRSGFDRAAAVATTTTLATQSRLTAFAGAATVAGMNAGNGWFAGNAQGFNRTQSSAASHVAALRSILAVNLFAQGAAAGDSYAAGLAAGLDRAVARARGATAAILAELNRAAELAQGFAGLGI